MTDDEKMVTLYTGTDCHLCDLARHILDDVVGPSAYRIVNITGQAELEETYGIRIPVIKNAWGSEKGWPFTAGQVKKLLGSR